MLDIRINGKELLYHNPDTEESVVVIAKVQPVLNTLVLETEKGICTTREPAYFDEFGKLSRVIDKAIGLRPFWFVSEKIYFQNDAGYHGVVYKFNAREKLYLDLYDKAGNLILNSVEIEDDFGIDSRILQRVSDAMSKVSEP